MARVEQVIVLPRNHRAWHAQNWAALFLQPSLAETLTQVPVILGIGIALQREKCLERNLLNFKIHRKLKFKDRAFAENARVDVNQNLERGEAGAAGGVEDWMAAQVPAVGDEQATVALERIEAGHFGVLGFVVVKVPDTQ